MANMKKSFRGILDENDLGKQGPPEIPKSDIIIGDQIGEGGFGAVYAGKLKGMDVAIKIPHADLSEEELGAFAEEIKVLRTIFHPHVVLFLGACTEEGKIRIVTEKMEMDVENYLQKNKGRVNLLEKMRILRGAALGLTWIHGLNMIHRDVKPANLLLDKNAECKITDFGFTELKKKKEKDEDEPKGTALYMAPEVMSGKDATFATDIFSFGLTIWEIYTEQELFPEWDDPDKFMTAIVDEKLRPIIPPNCPPLLKSLMERCWDENPEARPTAEDVANLLAEIIVDENFPEIGECSFAHESRKFWKENFLDRQIKKIDYLSEEVPWPKFSQVLSSKLNLPAQNFTDLKQFLVHVPKGSNEERVAMKTLHQVVQWFGPFYLPQKGPAILTMVSKLTSSQWFHGEISKNTSEDRLRSRDSGTFLVRLSTTNPDCPFTISKNRDGNPPFAHKRVKYVAKQERISVPVRQGGNKEYKDLFDLVGDPEQGLKHACPEDTKPFNPYSEDE